MIAIAATHLDVRFAKHSGAPTRSCGGIPDNLFRWWQVTLGTVEVLVVSFPGNYFNGGIIPELERLTSSGTITVIDGVFVTRDEAGDVTFVETEQLDAGHHAVRLAKVLDQDESLVSDEDIAELADTLAPGDSHAILVFEHTWAKPFRDAIVSSGGILTGEMRLPGLAVDELLDELAALD